MKIDLTCRACGSNHFTLDAATTDPCLISCQECGEAIGTLGALKEQVADMVLGGSRPAAPVTPSPRTA